MLDKKLIDILDVKEKQALAFTSIYKEKLEYDDLQKAIDQYCSNMACNFLEANREYLQKDNNLLELRKYLCSVQADKPYSGKRVHEALYKIIDKAQTKSNNRKKVH